MITTAAIAVGFYTIDVSAFIQTLVNTGATHAGFLIKSATEGSEDFAGADFASSEFITVGDRPNLTVVVPEPGTLAIFGLGLAGLGLVRRRRTA